MTDDDASDPEEPLAIEVGDTLDLHVFSPRDAKGLVRDWLDACVEKGYTEVRVIHGKGTGTLRRIACAVLDAHPAVIRHAPAGDGGGGWGATVAWLRVPGAPPR
jgi:dsDNA-specific endonuclease/ATPase MutS2